MNKKLYYSQLKQDKFLNEHIFKNFYNGIFLDLGAYDGITFSNTYFFEKNLNWVGWCFEPIKKYYNEMRKIRKCKCYNNCISDKTGIVNFNFFPQNPMSSGVLNNNNIKDKIIIIKSETIKIKDFLKDNNIKNIHLLSLDIEGNEEKILNNINFNETFIHIVCFEDNHNKKICDKTLKRNNFILIKHCGFDKIYINKKSRFFSWKYIFYILEANIINKIYTKNTRYLLKKITKRFPKINIILRRILNI